MFQILLLYCSAVVDHASSFAITHDAQVLAWSFKSSDPQRTEESFLFVLHNGKS